MLLLGRACRYVFYDTDPASVADLRATRERLGLRRPVHSRGLAPVGSMRRTADAYVRVFNEQSLTADTGVSVTASFVISDI